MSSPHARSFAENLNRFAELVSGDPLVTADADMKYLLEVHAGLGARPIEHCVPEDARRQPPLQAAVDKLLGGAGREAAADPEVTSDDGAFPGPGGDVPIRIYRSRHLDDGPHPLILYIHGGGWVLGDLDSADRVARMLARKTGAIVVSTHYRQGPEHRFPAGHEDTYAAWLWLLENARELGGDPARAAVVGEGAGGNMALNIALSARDEAMRQPLHQVLIHPIAGGDMSRPSYVENMRARPLNTFTMQWFVRHAFSGKGEMADPRIDLVSRDDLAGLPPTTIILAEIDPLRSEGEALGEALETAGVPVEVTCYDGVTHDFFGLAQIVNKALFAQSQVAGALSDAFARRSP